MIIEFCVFITHIPVITFHRVETCQRLRLKTSDTRYCIHWSNIPDSFLQFFRHTNNRIKHCFLYTSNVAMELWMAALLRHGGVFEGISVRYPQRDTWRSLSLLHNFQLGLVLKETWPQKLDLFPATNMKTWFPDKMISTGCYLSLGGAWQALGFTRAMGFSYHVSE